jgi:hypothetical protein
MMEVHTSEVEAIRAAVNVAQQWVKFGNHCWSTQQSSMVKQYCHYWNPLLSNNVIGWCLKLLLEDIDE